MQMMSSRSPADEHPEPAPKRARSGLLYSSSLPTKDMCLNTSPEAPSYQDLRENRDNIVSTSSPPAHIHVHKFSPSSVYTQGAK